MKRMVAVAFLLLIVSPASAVTMNSEPPPGMLGPGQVILVDDGTCGAGRIKQVTGGNNRGEGTTPRTRKCIKK